MFILARETHTEAGVAGREARSGLVEPAMFIYEFHEILMYQFFKYFVKATE